MQAPIVILSKVRRETRDIGDDQEREAWRVKVGGYAEEAWRGRENRQTTGVKRTRP